MTAPEDRIEAARDAARTWLEGDSRGDKELDTLSEAYPLANRAYLIPEERVALIAEAGQSRAAWDACAILFDRLQMKGESVPDDLAEFITQALLYGQRPSVKGRPRRPKRDAGIWLAVLAARREGLPAYSNSVNKTGITACDIVAEVLRDDCGDPVDPGAVRDIWMKHQNNNETG